MDTLSRAVLGSGEIGLFAYGVLNRVLIVTGLHHILNNLAWFLIGDYGGVTGDLKRFFAGDPAAGAFMSGFFPVMMFGLPAACLAMYHEARPERRRATGGLLASMALTSFLTGVTEPIEFTFMFLAPLLYAVHAVLTGLAMVLMDALGVRLGFSFSAGLFDYVINFGPATRPWMLLPIGLAYAVLYYVGFRFFIRRYGLTTPGREPEAAVPVAGADEPRSATERARAMVAALGGSANLRAVDACTTRLRLTVASQAAIDEAALRALGARGLVRPSADSLQVVLGPIADQVAGELRAALRDGGTPSAPGPPSAGGSGVAGDTVMPRGASFIAGAELVSRVLAALGGGGNVAALEAASTRILVTLRNGALANGPALAALGLRGIARPSPASVHLLIGPDAAALLEALRRADRAAV
jgi:PTS system N-acetylglucosamine-specific IIC component